MSKMRNWHSKLTAGELAVQHRGLLDINVPQFSPTFVYNAPRFIASALVRDGGGGELGKRSLFFLIGRQEIIRTFMHSDGGKLWRIFLCGTEEQHVNWHPPSLHFVTGCLDFLKRYPFPFHYFLSLPGTVRTTHSS